MELDSNVNGTWTLQVIDTQGGEAGTLRSWSLELTSRWD
jgi:subtilisin-like proprotein convertase family protein